MTTYTSKQLDKDARYWAKSYKCKFKFWELTLGENVCLVIHVEVTDKTPTDNLIRLTNTINVAI